MPSEAAASPIAPPTTAPGPIEPASTPRFKSADGLALYGEWFPVDKPRGLALVVHGYAEHCGRYREVAHVLNRARLSVLTYDMRGHGRAEGQRGHVDSYRDYLADLDAAMDQLVALSDTPLLPRLLLGHSNGGLIALRALADPLRSDRIHAAVISSPFLGLKVRVSPAKGLLGRVAGRVAPTLSLPNELRIEDLTHDPGKLAERRVDTLCHEVASARWFTSALETHDYVLDMAHRIRVPTLWLVAADDRIADPAASKAVHRRLRSWSRLHMLGGMFHEVFNETDRGRVFGLVHEFVGERFSS